VQDLPSRSYEMLDISILRLYWAEGMLCTGRGWIWEHGRDESGW